MVFGGCPLWYCHQLTGDRMLPLRLKALATVVLRDIWLACARACIRSIT